MALGSRSLYSDDIKADICSREYKSYPLHLQCRRQHVRGTGGIGYLALRLARPVAANLRRQPAVSRWLLAALRDVVAFCGCGSTGQLIDGESRRSRMDCKWMTN